MEKLRHIEFPRKYARKLSREAFCIISRAIPLQKSKSDMMKLFNSLKGSVNIGEIPNVTVYQQKYWTIGKRLLQHGKRQPIGLNGGQDFLTYACCVIHFVIPPALMRRLQGTPMV